ncbi:Fur family transcriptional regulator [Roseobacter sp. HKCCA0434]|uniref:Fur family transcriptional regulator n=1 Tax=Roseobacter sp. HKCCA0434 TaxID=3079297 RepID=UPI0029059530|nr:Fur family transcriptional regulator [Roseobacter sp. HKCCA0434]
MTDLSRYERQLKEAGLRLTGPRRLILRILTESGDHPDAAEIVQRATARGTRLSLATVYRTMKVLEETGTVERHAFQGGPARFEKADRAHHDHLIDLDTGDVVEFTSPRIEELQRAIAEELGYEIVDHRLELYGRKIRCE